ncbi:SusC/RagA family TonB-linked outer membrane protein [Marinifilum caeruleilacunae]|uniref:SusC/RagA family TonB-linked outer membrane protein n=1 Tax=Marinifilum caeruleilacunae TaxID=2499076 RepID=A0ABX1WXJ3_9BACT|nr:SusC/RagA family TonB-linked outer membrane protein [Marinifilum caeruleilacunae]NOU60855.1 SusC/RagA family TonB-linked outer membrane protein [Marinifilum caeruleilacunae]
MQKRKEFFAVRLLFFFLLFVFSGQKSRALPQEERLELNMKGVDLIQVISEIKERTDYTFLYSVDDIKKVKGINLSGPPKSVKDILTQCLSESGLTYEIRDRLIIIKPESNGKTSDESGKKSEQVKKFSGNITDRKGMALPGVSVLIKGTYFGTSTDINGNYSLIAANDPNTILVFSFIGMETKEIRVGELENLDVILFPSDEKLREVVVTTGFQKIDRSLFTGAANKLNQEDIALSGIADVSRSLQGHVSGVQVDNISGTFGTSPIVRIRGKASINGSNKPLWVVDGVVQEDIVELTNNDLTSGNLSTVLSSGVVGINPDDIESYQILKDASATALYGARAMNGVIVITTKQGKTGKPQVRYSGSVILRQKPSYSQFDILSSNEEMVLYEELYEKGWIDIAQASSASNHGALSKMFNEIANNNLSWGPDGGLNYQFLSKYANTNTDWFDVLFQNSLSQQHSFAISGGDDKSRYYGSLGYYHDNGQTVADNVKNYTALAKADFDVSKRLKLGFKLSANKRDQHLPGSKDRKFEPITGIYERNFDINPFNYALYTSRSIRPYDDQGELEYFRRDYAPFNILYELDHNYVNVDVDDILFQGDLQFAITSKLRFRTKFQGRWVSTLREQKIHESSNHAESYRADNPLFVDRNSFLFDDPDAPERDPYTVLPRGGFYNTTKNTLTSYFVRNIVDWKIKSDHDHIANLLFGQEIRYTDRVETHNEEWGYLYNEGGLIVTDPNVARYLKFRDQKDHYRYKEKYRFTGIFLTGAYSYKGRYIFNSTFRYDGDNRQGKNSDSRYLPTWNISAAWNMHDEDFMKTFNFIDRLKLKATYGLSGDNGVGASPSLILKADQPLRPTSGDGETILYIDELANKDLTWEKLYEFNMGMELEVFKGRFYADLEYYRRKSKDLLGFVTTSGVGGIRTKYGNVGEMEINGFEFTLSSQNIREGNFKWDTRLTFSYGKDKITEYFDEPRIGDAIQTLGTNIKGYSSNSLFSIPFAGLDGNGVPLFYGPDGRTIQSLNLQKRIDILNYLKYEGPTTPKGFGGLENIFKYKNWTLSLGINYRFGNKVRLEDAFSDSYDDYSSLPGGLKNRWRKAGDEHVTNIPAILSRWDSEALSDNGLNPYQLYNKSTARVADGSFVRIKNISLNYNLPDSWLRSLNLQSANIKLQAYNLGLLYSDKKLNGIDPEFFQSGGISLPMARTYSFSVNLGF